jgi:hypothetical protein
MCPLSSAPFRLHTPPVGLVICGVAPPPHRASLPHTSAWVLALVPRSSLRSRPHDRPHVSIAETFRSALAACGIPPDTPCGWSLLMSQHESTCQVPPCPVPIVRILRAVRSTGLLGSADRSVPPVAGAVSVALLAPAFQPLALALCHDGSTHLCLRCPEMPARRDTRIKASKVRRVSPLPTVEDQSPAWGIGWHSCPWRGRDRAEARAPQGSRFLRPPCDPLRSDFPRSVLTLAFLSRSSGT